MDHSANVSNLALATLTTVNKMHICYFKKTLYYFYEELDGYFGWIMLNL